LTIALGSLIVTGAVALAALAAASDETPAATPVPEPPAVQEPLFVDIEPVCTGEERCETTTMIEFRRRKPNNKCVYLCTRTTQCVGSLSPVCCPLPCQEPFSNSFRERIEPDPPEAACPDATVDLCDRGEVMPPGEPD
jgi:hypothetical protein